MLTKAEKQLIAAIREGRQEEAESLIVDMMLASSGLKATTRVLAGCTAQEMALVLSYLKFTEPERFELVAYAVDFFTTHAGTGVDVMNAYFERLNGS